MKRIRQPMIPVHRMKGTQSPPGIEFSHLDMNDTTKTMMNAEKNEVHRDDYYLFLFLEEGYVEFAVDFETVQLQRESVFYLRPGQTHFATSGKDLKGWSLAMDPALIEKDYQNVFEMNPSTQSPIILDSHAISKVCNAIGLLQAIMQERGSVFSNHLISGTAGILIGIIAEQYRKQQAEPQHGRSRSAQIAYQFRRCLADHFRSVKSPSQYAEILNCSRSHLNESVKSATGFSVSCWITQQVIMEAKRLLCHTDLDIREIAFRLGYEDHCYFSRLFSKTAGISPQAFRIRYHG